MKTTKKKDPYKMTPIMLFGWSGRAVSLASNFIVLMQLNYFCTEFLGIPALLAGSMLLGSKIFDGVSDLFAGFLIDKTNTRWGKARPYEFSIIGVWLCTVLLFACPEFGIIGKCVWVVLMYTFVNSIFSTLLNSTESVYLGRAFKYVEDRNKLVAINGVMVTLFATVVSIVFPILMGTLGTQRSGWVTIALIFAVPLTLIGMMRFLFVKEVNVDAKVSAQKLTIQEFKRALSSGKYIYLLAGALLILQLVTNIGSSVNAYYFNYIVGDVKLMSVVSMVGLVTPFLLLIVPQMLKKITPAKLIICSAVVSMIGYFIRMFAGANLFLLIVSALLTGAGSLPLSYFAAVMVIDIMDYNQWKNHFRVEGAFSSITGFANKVGSGLASALVGIIMGLAGYVGGQAEQTPATISAIVALASWLPALMMIIIIVLMSFYDLDKKIPEIRSELEARKQNGEIKG